MGQMTFEDWSITEYLQIIDSIKRPGFKGFIEWLHNNTDFMTAPASSKYHGAKRCGLLEHSLAVYDNLVSLAKNYDLDTLKIVALYHDICKANFYEESTRNVKNEFGAWEQVPYYKINELFPYGSHGGKSVYLIISHGLEITDEEAIAINNHMGAWDLTNYHNPSQAYEKYPLALYLHIADMLATYIDKA